MDQSSISGIPKILEKTLYDLNTISQINRGEKISTTSEYLNIEEDNFLLQPFGRSIRGDNRERAVNRLCYIVELALEYADVIMESHWFNFIEKNKQSVYEEPSDAAEIKTEHTEYMQRKSWIKLVMARLTGSILGLNNFVETYKTDGNVVGRVQPLVVRSREYLTKIEKFIKSLEHTEASSLWYRRYMEMMIKGKN